MVDNTNNDYFTKKHARLFDLARVASIAAWVVLIYQIISTLGSLNIFRALFFPRVTSLTDLQNEIRFMVKENLFTAIEQFIGNFGYLIKGFVYFLLLKGISAGLFMILETDLNYKDKLEEVSYE